MLCSRPGSLFLGGSLSGSNGCFSCELSALGDCAGAGVGADSFGSVGFPHQGIVNMSRESRKALGKELWANTALKNDE